MSNKSTMKRGTTRWMTGFAALVVGMLTKAADGPAVEGKPLTNKTLVVWAGPANPISSNDLVHWRHHPDALASGAWSGGGFLEPDGTAYLTNWKLDQPSGIGLAKSSDPYFEHWEQLKSNPVVKSTDFGITETKAPGGTLTVTGSADPSNIWKKDGRYYMLGGNVPILNKYGRKPDSPAKFTGDHLYLYESADLENWQYKGEFYDPKNDKFIPESHGRMTWKDTTMFAPEALIDGKGRQIMWAWVHDNARDEKQWGWSGVFCLPRLPWLGADGTLRMRPVPELNMLRMQEQERKDLALAAGETKCLENDAVQSILSSI